MSRLLFGLKLENALVAVLVACAMALSACGSDNPCDGVSCDFGVCDSSSGQCKNENYCETDQGCLPGYQCTLDHACEAVSECSADSDCGAGVCKGGVCVNPKSCQSNDDCLARTYCGPKNKCIPDPCNDVSCQRGVCARGTDKCVSADSCTPETEQLDCVAGEKCAEGACKPAETFCDDITCDRGVCSFEAGGCGNADNCDGDDAKCADGYFCNDQNTCQEDLCARDNVDCGGNGVCIPAAGECQNATSCQSNDDCLANHLCVEGTCRLASVACGEGAGDGGCPGNQTCEYDESAQTASCAEPDVCQTSLDCTGDRQCGGRGCLDPVACTDDFFEPNNTDANITSFIDQATAHTLSASLCGADTDLFTVKPSDLLGESNPSTLPTGTMVVEVDVAQHDIGLGEVKLVVKKDGSEVDHASTGALSADGKARLEIPIGATNQGAYTVEVSAGDDLNTAGVRYALSINLLDDASVNACANAVPALLNQRLSGTTDTATSNTLGSSCTSPSNPSNEVIYQFDVPNPAEVTIKLTPELSDSNFSMSLRKACEQAATEQACADAGGDGETETLTRVLDAGTWYLIVQAPDGATGGAFQLLIQSLNTFCAPSDDFCSDADTANVCSSGGGRFVAQQCANGCNPTTGHCVPLTGDTCNDSPVIDSDVSQQIDLLQVNNDYSAAGAGCVAGESTNSAGPDETYQVNVPAQTSVSASATFSNEVAGSVYFVEDCADTANTCAAGGATDDNHVAEAAFDNDTDQAKTVFLIVDSAANQHYGDVQLDVSFNDIKCTPDNLRCSPDDPNVLQACNEHGTEYVTSAQCDLGCSNAACIGDTCDMAMDVTAQAKQPGGATLTGGWDSFTNTADIDNTADSGCGGAWQSSGPEVFFAVTVAAGDTIEASWEAGGDGVIWIANDCTNIPNSCLDGHDGGNPETLQYTATTAGTYYVVGDAYSSTPSSDFSMQIRVLQSCDPSTSAPTCVAGGVQFCSADGVLRTNTCGGSGSCTNAVCDTQDAATCFGAENLTTQARQSGGASVSNDWSTLTNDDGSGGVCSLSTDHVDGTDTFYQFDLNAGEILTASLDTGKSSVWGTLALTTSCTGSATCLASVDNADENGSITYYSPTDQTVFLRVDNDSPGASSTYTLDASIEQADCDPANYPGTCSAGQLQLCDPSGQYVYHNCAFGCGGGASCGDPACTNPPDVTPQASLDSGFSFSGVWGDYSNDITGDGGGGPYGCSNIDAPDTEGQDLVYSVDLTDGQTLVATLDNPDHPSSWNAQPTVAIVASCGTLSESVCKAGATNTDGAAKAIYHATRSETVFVIFDHAGTSADASADRFAGHISLEQSCDSTSYSSVCSTSSAITSCGSDGYVVNVNCSGSTCSSAACGAQTNDTCPDAVDVTASGTYVGSFDDISDNYDCNGTGDGGDAAYAVTLSAGQTLSATLTGSADTVLSLGTSCDANSLTCTQHSDSGTSGDPETVTYTASSDETVYLIADGYWSSASGDYTLDISIH